MCVWFHGILLRIFAHKLWNMQKCYAASETVTILFSLRHMCKRLTQVLRGKMVV